MTKNLLIENIENICLKTIEKIKNILILKMKCL